VSVNERYRTALFVTKKTYKIGSRLQKVKCWLILISCKARRIFAYIKIIKINKLLYGKTNEQKLNSNCYNSEKVLSFVAPSGEQKLT